VPSVEGRGEKVKNGKVIRAVARVEKSLAPEPLPEELLEFARTIGCAVSALARQVPAAQLPTCLAWAFNLGDALSCNQARLLAAKLRTIEQAPRMGAEWIVVTGLDLSDPWPAGLMRPGPVLIRPDPPPGWMSEFAGTACHSLV